MFYHIFKYLDQTFSLAGAGLFQYISFRAILAMITSLLIAMIFGRRTIAVLQKRQIGETIRDLGLERQLRKKGTPTMGGLIIIAAIVIPILLFANLYNVYIILLLITVLWMGLIGFLDDYIKNIRKKKTGLKGKFKIFGQIALGLLIGLTLYFHEDVLIRDFHTPTNPVINAAGSDGYVDYKSTKTTIPFLKNNELDYTTLFFFVPDNVLWICYILVVTFIITAVSNGANITDGLDGLAAGTSAIIGLALAVLAYVSGHAVFAHYLNIMFIPHSGETVVFCTAFVGACIGFLWYNTYPAQVFMGDTGSLSLGAAIAVLAIIIRKELLIPILCGIFLLESLSVIIQVSYFKCSKKKYGEGRRILLMSPIHHHYEKMGIPETRIVTRFWIIGLLLALLTLATLKVR